MVGTPSAANDHASRRPRRSKIHSLGNWLGAGLDLLFPIQCAGCREPGAFWCQECDSQLVRIREPICVDCGLDLHTAGRCPSCRQQKPALRIRSHARYTGRLVQALLALKYRPDRRLAEVMGGWLWELLAREGWNPSIIVPVPLSVRRRQQRGFNQAELLAEALARRASIRMRASGLKRVRETRSQVGLDRWERWQNVNAAFEVPRNDLRGEAVLLVDDLTTTGATLSSCAAALHAAGARQVWGLTVGRA